MVEIPLADHKIPFAKPRFFSVRLLTNNDTKGRNPKLSIRKKLIEMFNAYRFLMNNPTFLIYCTAISFAFASNVLMFIILPPHNCTMYSIFIN
jgi:hypothetical protein